MEIGQAKKKDSLYPESRLTNAFTYIRRRAFGYNSKSTCSAVSVALAVNYLNLEGQGFFVPET